MQVTAAALVRGLSVTAGDGRPANGGGGSGGALGVGGQWGGSGGAGSYWEQELIRPV